MKKYIITLFFLVFAVFNAIAQVDVTTFKFDHATIPSEGGTVACRLEYTNNPDGGRLVSGEVKMTGYSNHGSNPLLLSVTNNNTMFFVEFDPINVEDDVQGYITIYFDFRDYNNNDSPWRQCAAYLNYKQNKFTGLWGGIIAFEGKPFYEPGMHLPQIKSVQPAMGGDPALITYTWEKKSVSNPNWRVVPDQTGETCWQPGVMEEGSVYYRRKATKGSLVSYSNIIDIMSELNAGLITLTEVGFDTFLFLNEKKKPSVLEAYTAYERSTDMKTWEEFSRGRLNVSFLAPSQTTYYRRVAEDTNENKAYSNIVRYNLGHDPYITTKTALDSLATIYNEDIAYYDGLGRPSQSINVGGSPTGDDIITPYGFDFKGRQQNDYLPFIPDQNGEYQLITTDNLTEQQEAYYRRLYGIGGRYAYIHREYDDSPLDRVTKTFRHGKEYQEQMDHFAENIYALNQGADGVLCLEVSDNGSLVCDGTIYASKTLYKSVVVNEDGARQETFTDTNGRTLLVRQLLSDSERADTYFAYDDLDCLRWVISPEGSVLLGAGTNWNVESTAADNYCYRYIYDGDGNVMKRYIPGRATDRMTYDAVGRVLTSQTGAMRSQGVELFYDYDNIGRVSRVALQRATNEDGGGSDPLNPGDPRDPFDPTLPPFKPIDPGEPLDPTFPPVIIDPTDPRDPNPGDPIEFDPGLDDPIILLSMSLSGDIQSRDTQRYIYDAYDLSSSSPFAAHAFTIIEGITKEEDLNLSVRGLKTHEEIFEVFDASALVFSAPIPGSSRRTFYYDKRHRLIQSFETSPMEHTLRVSCKYDYPGNMVEREELYLIPGCDPLDVRYTYTYDERGRQLREQVSVNGEAKTDIASSYDDLGRLIKTEAETEGGKNLEMRYQYNIQGWMTNISSTLLEYYWDIFHENQFAEATFVFSQSLNYFTPKVAAPSYSGNIAEINWMHQDLSDSRFYAYTYDKLNRLTDAELYKPARGIWDPPTLDNSNTERGITYDLNGNIQTLERMSMGYSSSDLIYHYTGNKLTTLEQRDQSEMIYTYDQMGNMTQDGVLGPELSYSYNFLNLMEKVIVDLGAYSSGVSTMSASVGGGTDIDKRKAALRHSITNLLDQQAARAAGNGIQTMSATTSSDNIDYYLKYSYLWDGTRQSIINFLGDGYVYLGSLVYIKVEDELVLMDMGFSKGRFVFNGASDPVTNYHVRDHLGSVRAIVNEGGNVIEESNYHPFGTRWEDYSRPTTDNRYRYNGKETLEFLGFPYSDYGARMYDPLTGRWLHLDPLAASFLDTTPFAFCGNNPINKIDPDGRAWGWLIKGGIRVAKGAIAAGVDMAAQVQVARADGASYREAFGSVDYTSVGASFIAGAALSKSMSTAAKAVAATAIAADVAVDYSTNDGIQHIGGMQENNKPVTRAIVDLGAAVIPGKVADGLLNGVVKSATSDLASNGAKTLTKEAKTALKQVKAVAESEGAQVAATSVSDFVGALVGGVINTVIPVPLPEAPAHVISNQNTDIIPADATYIHKFKPHN
jgi:cell well associated rhsD protein